MSPAFNGPWEICVHLRPSAVSPFCGGSKRSRDALAADAPRLHSGAVKLLFIGDVVGRPGRRAVQVLVPKLRERHGIRFVVANGENSAGGSGITPDTAQELVRAGVDVITC